jgi:peptide/nickel transport system ATP-binding protein
MNASFSHPQRLAMDQRPIILSMRNFSVAVANRGGMVPIVRGIDMTLHAGECVGIVGESGCGKSITWLAALRLLGTKAVVSGQAWLGGVDLVSMSDRAIGRVRGKKIAIIFQDPTACLNPIQRIGQQLCEAINLHRGLSGSAIIAEAKRLLDRVGIADAPRRLQQYPHELSGGMNQRVMIAIALAGNPEVLVADEPTTALDATIQAQILDLLREVQRETGMALVLISHDLGVVADICDRIAVMYAGKVVETGSTADILSRPHHPYTRGLLSALPDLEGPRARLASIRGMVPPPGSVPPGCSFAPRCDHAAARCRQDLPPLLPTGSCGQVACWHTGFSDVPASEAQGYLS